MTSTLGGSTDNTQGRKTTSVVSVRLTPTERHALTRKADSCRMALSAFIRASALCAATDGAMELTPRPTVKRLSTTERTQIALVLACMARLMDSIREFEGDDTDSNRDQHLILNSLKRDIMSTRDQCFKGMGRLP